MHLGKTNIFIKMTKFLDIKYWMLRKTLSKHFFLFYEVYYDASKNLYLLIHYSLSLQ
jgi:hypothetical protein